MHSLGLFALISLLPYLVVAQRASTFAGATTTAVFPPPNAGIAATDTNFPDGSKVGFPGPTRTGDEAAAIETAPVAAKVDSFFPLINGGAEDSTPMDPFDVLVHLGNLSPFQSVPSSAFGLPGASPLIPEGCDIVQAHLLHRHGARYPTADSGPPGFAAKVNAAANSGSGFSAKGDLSFLNTWTYKLGGDILTPFGRSQLFNLGVGFRVKYGQLLKGFKNLPVFRTTSEARMLDSALHFATGFFGVQKYQDSYHQLITIEHGGKQNNTLAPYESCTNGLNDVAAFGDIQSQKWAQIYLAPAVKRLNANLRGLQLNVTDLFAMQQLCAFETVALGYSSFCDLFTEEEWRGFEYQSDLQFWYSFGPGNPASSAMGIGYVQELVSRLTKTRITTFDTTVNASIVTSDILFPLDQPIYVDATHDTILTAIFAAMNLTTLAANGPLPTDHIPKGQTFFANQLAPFAANVVGQVLSCPASSKPTHIRWIINDGVVPLTGIKGCKPDKNGMCEINTFIAGMKQRMQEIDFNFDCFANYTVPIPDDIVNGQYPQNLKPKKK
ncbi:3-phytase A [Psilocybe cubensis]|uniref:Phosphoglycerate mutase-like protein n=2 Tax=Psilocybe cubensis TaxID=181762 RepID=A0A8H8CPR5_PSICU|nr:3-phytase A [Psilocybe cubensis]KAH9484974.1 3-phytase A [Psilocybe cubensis]